MQRIPFLMGVLLLAVAACGSTSQPIDAPPPPNDAETDAQPIDAPTDAPIDAAVMAPQGQDITNAGGTLSGPTFTMDVQVGHPYSQKPMTGTQFRLEGNTPIKP